MSEGRNKQGQFIKGHSGFKPKGAVSRKKQLKHQQLDQLLNYFDRTLGDDINALSPQQKVRLWLKLTSLLVPKLKRVPYVPEPPQETVKKIIIKVVPPVISTLTDNVEVKEEPKLDKAALEDENPLPQRRSRLSAMRI